MDNKLNIKNKKEAEKYLEELEKEADILENDLENIERLFLGGKTSSVSLVADSLITAYRTKGKKKKSKKTKTKKTYKARNIKDKRKIRVIRKGSKKESPAEFIDRQFGLRKRINNLILRTRSLIENIENDALLKQDKFYKSLQKKAKKLLEKYNREIVRLEKKIDKKLKKNSFIVPFDIFYKGSDRKDSIGNNVRIYLEKEIESLNEKRKALYKSKGKKFSSKIKTILDDDFIKIDQNTRGNVLLFSRFFHVSNVPLRNGTFTNVYVLLYQEIEKPKPININEKSTFTGRTFLPKMLLLNGNTELPKSVEGAILRNRLTRIISVKDKKVAKNALIVLFHNINSKLFEVKVDFLDPEELHELTELGFSEKERGITDPKTAKGFTFLTKDNFVKRSSSKITIRIPLEKLYKPGQEGKIDSDIAANVFSKIWIDLKKVLPPGKTLNALGDSFLPVSPGVVPGKESLLRVPDPIKDKKYAYWEFTVIPNIKEKKVKEPIEEDKTEVEDKSESMIEKDIANSVLRYLERFKTEYNT